MTAAELIKELQKFPQDMVVDIGYDYDNSSQISNVCGIDVAYGEIIIYDKYY